MNQHCALTFVVAQAPWSYERAVIERLDPPLNILGGRHPFRETVQAARSALRSDCG